MRYESRTYLRFDYISTDLYILCIREYINNVPAIIRLPANLSGILDLQMLHWQPRPASLDIFGHSSTKSDDRDQMFRFRGLELLQEGVGEE